MSFEAGLRTLNLSQEVDLSEVLREKRQMRKGFSPEKSHFPIPDLLHPDTVVDLEQAAQDPALAYIYW